MAEYVPNGRVVKAVDSPTRSVKVSEQDYYPNYAVVHSSAINENKAVHRRRYCRLQHVSRLYTPLRS